VDHVYRKHYQEQFSTQPSDCLSTVGIIRQLPPKVLQNYLLTKVEDEIATSDETKVLTASRGSIGISKPAATGKKFSLLLFVFSEIIAIFAAKTDGHERNEIPGRHTKF
jgi:hypothetical protein